MSDLPKRTVEELAMALRQRAGMITGAHWEVVATADMMREAADLLLALRERDQRLIAQWRESAKIHFENARRVTYAEQSLDSSCRGDMLEYCADQLTAEGRSRAEARTP